MNETERIFTITKAEPDKMQVFGWASVAITADGQQISDHEGDVIQPDELEKAAYEYVLKFRDTGERHDPDKRKKGKLIESVVLTKEKQEAMGIPAGYLPEGWWVGFQITDEDAWAKIKSGEYKMFSVEGRGERESLDPPAGTGGIAKGFNEIIKYQHEGRRVNGVGVLVQAKDGRLLVGTRLDGKHAGQICGAGGHIENGETPSQAAVREAREEFGIECRNLKELGYKDSGSAYGQSCIFLCTEWDGEPSTDEEEMTALEWLTPAELKDRKLFRPFEESLKFLSVAKSFKEIIKFNPYHDAGGRFASANGGGFRGPMLAPDGKGGGAGGRTTLPWRGGGGNIDPQKLKRLPQEMQEELKGKIAIVEKREGNEINPIEKKDADVQKVAKEAHINAETAQEAINRASDLYDRVAQVEPEITRDMVSAVEQVGGQMYGLDARMKSVESLARKIGTDYGDPEEMAYKNFDMATDKITDAVRYTMELKGESFTRDYNTVKASLEEQGYSEVRCRNFYLKYELGKSQQKAVQCLYEKDGLTFEVQFHTKDTLTIKEANHDRYEEYRVMPKEQQEHSKRGIQLNHEMKQLSGTIENPKKVLDIKHYSNYRYDQ